MSDVVRWGILSTAKIAARQVIPAMQKARNCQVVAVSSRDSTKARELSEKLGIPKVYGDYDSLLEDAEIDAIYNPLPNHLHVEWSIKALQAGKHVLCEKPLGLSSTEARELQDVAKQHPGLKVMEAFMYRHHPQWQYALGLIESGRLGKLCAVNTLFSYFNRLAEDIRNQPEMGGGGLMDIGCYPISLSRFLFRKQPERVVGRLEYDPEFQTDRLASAMLDFGSGLSTFTCSTQMVPYQRVQILGTEGRFEIEIPFNAPVDRPCKAWLELSGESELMEFPVCDQYTIQAELFAEAVLSHRPVTTPLKDAIENMQVIEAIVKSDRENCWVSLNPTSSSL